MYLLEPELVEAVLGKDFTCRDKKNDYILSEKSKEPDTF